MTTSRRSKQGDYLQPSPTCLCPPPPSSMRPSRPRIRLAPQLSSITLDDILSGETCEPIALADFESYLLFKEYSVENLRFVVWYQSYRRRFFALPREQQDLSPGPRGFKFALPTPARTAERISRTSTRLGSIVDEPVSPTGSLNPLLPPTSLSPMLSRIPSVSPSGPSSTPHMAPGIQPFREECALVASTFLVPSAPYELALPSLLLSTILRDLAFNTHPDVFLPAYEHAYDAMLTHSLPHFLDGTRENMNWGKRAYWWLYGVLTTCLGWAIVVGCLFIQYGPHMSQGRRRAWRLLGVPFLTLGAMQMYSAHRGFCSQIWGRGATQLRPWELASLPPPPAHDKTPRPAAAARAKVFGPERVVLDPRIRAVHRRVVRDLLLAGFVSGSLLTVVVVALPCGR
ncbi:hypothetical protein PHLGIDRAFT_125613 [Phlebiopsis gigantea 11061_1 CR5-6]|uniref:RGS domain-containing protein n=1 Tax=Phlebiopsis gigantea (strain 11061_1 CR5-6) TaxID=745531 RepID=A0A0C3NYB9_PHLG1|nr:hypothetical protein PHLGIDRAFT_125613 [Phlebiopsis gigantea 11061_1 CR5-6]